MRNFAGLNFKYKSVHPNYVEIRFTIAEIELAEVHHKHHPNYNHTMRRNNC